MISGDRPLKFHAIVSNEHAPMAFIAMLIIKSTTPAKMIGLRLVRTAGGIAATPIIASSTNHGIASLKYLGP